MIKHEKMSYGLTLSALGVVYGDIGTSPLYALRETLGDLPLNLHNILGILSLIFWSFVLIISIKYLIIIFRADNNGEGGILALLALLKQKSPKYEYLFYLIAIFGAGLLLGDGMLTPAISVASAVEGLEEISTYLVPYILPLACIILLVLFSLQYKGTAKLGAVFGPLILIWFVTIAVLGLVQIVKNPIVLKAINPYYALHFLQVAGWRGYFLLGGIFLVVTGGEALYADIGHFGKNPIRYSWFFIVFPSLILNYMGQGAFLLNHVEAITNPFYMIAPEWFKMPLIFIATIATVIASQSILSATFSLTKQAVLLGFCPRVPIIQTSKEHPGQIYIPHINIILFIGTLFLLVTFKNSSNLAHAYGIAINVYMLLITVMVTYSAIEIWRWPIYKVILIFGLFLMIDLAFLGANSHKFLTGGWVPIVFATLVAFVMYTWSVGLDYLRKHFYIQKEAIEKTLKQLHYKSIHQMTGITAIFITDVYDKSGGSFLHFLKLSRALPEHILIVNYVVENIPYVPLSKRYELVTLTEKVCQLTLHYGFMDTVSVPQALEHANKRKILPFAVNTSASTYFIEVPNIIASTKVKSLMFHFQEKLFAFLMRNYTANLNIEFYNLPYNRTIAIGAYCII
ncbi:MAG TPA: KUP/HAK/KT family potassium transporter [Legionella sp.]|nr:KUP/HAK/KT family potassium transporter [Legionella sp.]